MILTLSRTGQMCNQLMTLVAVYALGLKHGEAVVCPVMDQALRQYFTMDSTHSPIPVKFYDNVICYWFGRILLSACLRLRLQGVLKKSYRSDRRGKLQWFLSTFWCKEDSTIISNLPEIQRFFSFHAEIMERSQQFISAIRAEGLDLVAAHVRRGDYRTFMGGKYYFTDEELMEFMRELNHVRKVKFVMFSNERVAVDKYVKEGLLVVQYPASAIDDLCRMSLCDYIMGPDSTYSWFAMMIGHKPRMLLEKGKKCSWNDFRLYENADNLRG